LTTLCGRGVTLPSAWADDERCFMPIHIYDTQRTRPVAVVLRPGKTPSGVEVRLSSGAFGALAPTGCPIRLGIPLLAALPRLRCSRCRELPQSINLVDDVQAGPNMGISSAEPKKLRLK
jgi:hypothetical protein